MNSAHDVVRAIAEAKRFDCDVFDGDEAFADWAQNLARAYIHEKPHEPPAEESEFGPVELGEPDRIAPHAAAEPEKPMDDDLPGMLAVAKGAAEQKWPHTMDATVWAREWIARTKDHPDVATDEGAMIGWFANAIMAGYDTAQARGGSYKEGWKDCVKAHDGLYPPHAEFQSPAAAETPLYASPSAQPIAREDAIDDVLLTLRHARVFITSREKMHPDGVELYDRLIAKLESGATLLRPPVHVDDLPRDADGRPVPYRPNKPAGQA